MPNPVFRYFHESGAVPTRVLADEAQPFLDAKLDDGTPKYIETTFRAWWDSGVSAESAAAWQVDADPGEFWSDIVDPETQAVQTIACSLETGEPIEIAAEPEVTDPATEATPESQASEATPAPAEPEVTGTTEVPSTEAAAS